MAPSTVIILLVQGVKERSCQKRVVRDRVIRGCVETYRDALAPTSGVFCPSPSAWLSNKLE